MQALRLYSNSVQTPGKEAKMAKIARSTWWRVSAAAAIFCLLMAVVIWAGYVVILLNALAIVLAAFIVLSSLYCMAIHFR